MIALEPDRDSSALNRPASQCGGRCVRIDAEAARQIDRPFMGACQLTEIACGIGDCESLPWNRQG
jgi:hypothetical protein